MAQGTGKARPRNATILCVMPASSFALTTFTQKASLLGSRIREGTAIVKFSTQRKFWKVRFRDTVTCPHRMTFADNCWKIAIAAVNRIDVGHNWVRLGMPAAPVQTRSVCPKCGKDLRLRSVREPFCVACNEPVRISWAYRRQVAYMALVIDALIALATYHQTSSGPWIIGLVLFWLLITFVLRIILPATYETGYPQPQITFVSAFLGMFITLFLVEFLAFLTLYVALGAKPAEVQEHLWIMSEPLVFFDQQFLITPEKTFLDVCGILLGNSFLIGIPFFVSVKIVQFFLRRNRALQIGIEGSFDKTDD